MLLSLPFGVLLLFNVVPQGKPVPPLCCASDLVISIYSMALPGPILLSASLAAFAAGMLSVPATLCTLQIAVLATLCVKLACTTLSLQGERD
jgi:membrane protein implicated in regulation of membrane protease activity